MFRGEKTAVETDVRETKGKTVQDCEMVFRAKFI